MGDWLVIFLVAQQALIMGAYCVQGFWMKAFYWLGVTIVNTSWLLLFGGKA